MIRATDQHITRRGNRLGVRLIQTSEYAAALLSLFIVPPTERIR